MNSSYVIIIYLLISSLDEIEKELHSFQLKLNTDKSDKYIMNCLILIDERFVKQCHFLEVKLKIKICIHYINDILVRTVIKIADKVNLLLYRNVNMLRLLNK